MINAPFNKPVFIIVCKPAPGFGINGVWLDETIHTSFDDVVKWVHEMQTEPSDISNIIEIDLTVGTTRDVTSDVAKHLSSICDNEEHPDLIEWISGHGYW
jgi:hypothetical protein